jgi:SAM-dependent methyltransferase
MDKTHAFKFPPGKTLETELSLAMRRIGNSGIIYPEGYYDRLVEKYSREKILYPFTLILAGNYRIHHHFFYSRLPKRTGRFLDYGCGTGDGVRKLIRDGFPREKISAFDLNWSGINLGFDLYLDRAEMSEVFTVSESFPFGDSEFDTVYSKFVIHCIGDDEELIRYLENAYRALRPGGVFFGSTIGMAESGGCIPPDTAIQRLTTRQQLTDVLAGAGFAPPAIVQSPVVPGHLASVLAAVLKLPVLRGMVRYMFAHSAACNNYNRHFFDFCTKKPE